MVFALDGSFYRSIRCVLHGPLTLDEPFRPLMGVALYGLRLSMSFILNVIPREKTLALNGPNLDEHFSRSTAASRPQTTSLSGMDGREFTEVPIFEANVQGIFSGSDSSSLTCYGFDRSLAMHDWGTT